MKDQEQVRTYLISAVSENTPGVLYRMANQFIRRKINIEMLHVEEIDHTGFSEFKIKVQLSVDKIAPLAQQIYKIIEVTEVNYEEV